MAFDNLFCGRNRKGIPLFLLVSLSLSLSGCQSSSEADQTVASSVSSVTPAPVLPSPQLKMNTASSERASNPEQPAEGSVSACQRELLALSKINQRYYAQKKAAFDNLLSSASVYTSVRGDIGSQTKDTMDALYKYKTQKLCIDIEQTVRQALISRGEDFR